MQPVLAYVVLALNIAVYGYGIFIALTDGGDASNDYFLSLAKVNEDVLNGQYWRCACAWRMCRLLFVRCFDSRPACRLKLCRTHYRVMEVVLGVQLLVLIAERIQLGYARPALDYELHIQGFVLLVNVSGQ